MNINPFFAACRSNSTCRIRQAIRCIVSSALVLLFCIQAAGQNTAAIQEPTAANKERINDYIGPQLFALSVDGSLLATFRSSGTNKRPIHELKLWSMASGRELGSFEEPYPLISLEFSPDAKSLAASGEGDDVRVWDVETRKVRYHLRLPSTGKVPKRGNLGKIAFASSGLQLYCPTQGNLAVITARSGAAQPLKRTPFRAAAIACGPTTLAVGINGSQRDRKQVHSTIEIYSLKTGRLEKNLAVESQLQQIAYSRDGSTLAASYRDGRIKLWNPQDWSEHATLTTTGSKSLRGFSALVLSPNGSHVAAIPLRENTEKVEIWNVSDKSVLKLGPPSPHHLAFVSSTSLTISSVGHPIRFYQVTTGKVGERPVPKAVANLPVKRLKPLPRAQALRKSGKFSEAITAYRDLLKEAEKKFGESSDPVLQLARSLAETRRAVGHYDEAVQLFSRCYKVTEPTIVPTTLEIPSDLDELVATDCSGGEMQRAERRLLDALKSRKTRLGAGHAAVANVEFLLGRVYDYMRDQIAANRHYSASLEIRRIALKPDHPDLAESLERAGESFMFLLKVNRAVPLLEESLRVHRSAFGPVHPAVAEAEMRLSQAYRQTGRLNEARQMLLKSFATLNAGDIDNLEGIYVLREMAQILTDSKRFAEAETSYKQALEIADRIVGPHDMTVALIHAGLGQNFRKSRRYRLAAKHSMRSVEIVEACLGSKAGQLSGYLSNLGSVYQSAGRYAEAESAFLRALGPQRKAGPGDHNLHVVNLNLAGVYLQQKRWTKSIEQFQIGVVGLHDFLTQMLSLLPDTRKFQYAQLLAEYIFVPLSAALEHKEQQQLVDRSAEWVANTKGLAVEALVERTLLARESKDDAAKDLLRQLENTRETIAGLTATGFNLGPGPTGQQVKELMKLQEKLATDLSEQVGYRMLADSWTPIERIREKLGKETALIEIMKFKRYDFEKDYVDSTRYVAWIIPPAGRGEIRIIDLGDSRQIETAISTYQRALKLSSSMRDEKRAVAQLSRATRTLSDLLVRPFESELARYHRWIISPDAGLWLVPWAALHTRNRAYLVESKEVNCITTSRQLVDKADKTKPNAAIVVANPDFNFGIPKGSTGSGLFSPLPGTAREAKAVIPKLAKYAKDQPLAFTGQYAQESAVKMHPRPRVLVFSTHAYFERQSSNPHPLLRCGIALAGANGAGLQGNVAGNDGILAGLEVVAIDLRGTELVVLSACETAVGKINQAEGVAGLQQAFRLAGAQSVLATLWSIPDQETADLMSSFFGELAAGRRKSEALRRAQLDMISARRKESKAAHPYYWAAFSLNGRIN